MPPFVIHVYGGDFVNQPRSEWTPETGVERPYEVAHVREQFAKANEAWKTARA